MAEYRKHIAFKGKILMVGFGAVGQGTLPLIERHFTYDPHRVHVIEPSDEHRTFLEQRGYVRSHSFRQDDFYTAAAR